MPFDRSALFDFLSELNEDLTRKIILVAVGGTAMTLLDLLFIIKSKDRNQASAVLYMSNSND